MGPTAGTQLQAQRHGARHGINEILAAVCRVAALHGRIDALYLNAGRQYFGKSECLLLSLVLGSAALAFHCLLPISALQLVQSVQTVADCDAHAGDTANSDLRQMQLVFETNFWGPVRVFQAALPLMPKTGAPRSSFPDHCAMQVICCHCSSPASFR